MDTNKPTRRIGTISFGILLILFGLMFILHLFIPSISYLFIFRLWPCIFIFLGIEILAGNKKENCTFVYDKTAIFLCLILTFFAMAMAVVDFCIQQSAIWRFY